MRCTNVYILKGAAGEVVHQWLTHLVDENGGFAKERAATRAEQLSPELHETLAFCDLHPLPPVPSTQLGLGLTNPITVWA